MFKKVICNQCKNKISNKYNFCPYCGSSLENSKNNLKNLNFKNNKNQEEKKYGLLGKNDLNSNLKNEIEINPLVIKSIEKIMTSLLKDINFDFPTNISGFNIVISGDPNDFENKINIIPINQNQKNNSKRVKNEFFNFFTKEQSEKFLNSKKEEPKTEIRRFSDVLVYEFFIPEVQSLKDISLLKLENSLELNALGKNISYKKVIPINMPIKNYSFSDGKLVLEFSIKN
jgi:hypothetical protein